MDQENKTINQLLKKYLSGKLSAREQQRLEHWFHHFERKDQTGIDHARMELFKKEAWQNIHTKTQPRPTFSWLYAAAAAVIIIVAGLLYYEPVKTGPEPEIQQTTSSDVQPGGPKAILILSTGKKIVLDEQANGLIAQDQGAYISKTRQGQLRYQETLEQKNTLELKYSTIVIPRAGKYQLTLPDGTMVWLNAASKLIFPSSFNGMKERSVQLEGEAYFEVAKNKNIPFVVNTQDQSVKVLGTHFNVSAYKNETTKTTLLEGKVEINGRITLNPGQQSGGKDGNLSIISVDPEESVAWKNGLFLFQDDDIYSVMNEVSRWYDVDVVFTGTPVKRRFSGKVFRNMTLKNLLNVLSISKVNYELKNRTIFIK